MDCIYKEVCTIKECNTNICLRNIEMSYLLESSCIPQKFYKSFALQPDNVDYQQFVKLRSIKDNIVDIVKSNEFNLLIYGNNTGNGKTSWAVKILLHYFDKIWAGNGLRQRGLFIHVPNFLLRLKDFDVKDIQLEEIKKILPTVDLVIWDDICSTNISDYDNTQLLNYIDSRIGNGKANIFTSNVDLNIANKCIGNRLTSRIWNNSIRIELKGKDRRCVNND